MAREWLAVAQVCDVRKSRMPSRKKINLQKVLASLYIVCTRCQAKIEPSQILRVRWDTLKCPYYAAVFVPQPNESERE